MSTLGCICGNLILDRTDDLAFKGYVIRDKHLIDLYTAIAEDIVTYLAAERNGDGQEWVAKHFEANEYQHQLDVSNVINGLWFKFFVKRSLVIYECEHCGRIWIEDENNHFRSFLPEEPDTQGILDVK